MSFPETLKAHMIKNGLWSNTFEFSTPEFALTSLVAARVFEGSNRTNPTSPVVSAMGVISNRILDTWITEGIQPVPDRAMALFQNKTFQKSLNAKFDPMNTQNNKGDEVLAIAGVVGLNVSFRSNFEKLNPFTTHTEPETQIAAAYYAELLSDFVEGLDGKTLDNKTPEIFRSFIVGHLESRGIADWLDIPDSELKYGTAKGTVLKAVHIAINYIEKKPCEIPLGSVGFVAGGLLGAFLGPVFLEKCDASQLNLEQQLTKIQSVVWR